MDPELLKLYGKGTTFRAQLAQDLDDGEVWFDPEEFGKFHDIDGVKILSVFVGDQRTQALEIRMNSKENPEGIYKSRGVLFVRGAEIEGVRAEQVLRLDGRLYTVAEARLIQDCVWRIVLEANEA